MRLELVNMDKGFRADRVVTNPEPVQERSGRFNEDGIFSERIFGKMPTTGKEYSCDCGTIQGRFHENVTCKQCQTQVICRDSAFSKRGWIDFGRYEIISPLFYSYVAKVVGATQLGRILGFERKMNINGIARDEGVGTNYENLGMLGFRQNWQEVLAHFERRFGNDPKKVATAKFIRENAGRMFTSKFPVFSHILRPAIVVDKQMIFEEVNNTFNTMLQTSRLLNDYSAPERTETNVNSCLLRIQELSNEIFQHILGALSGKGGYLRSSLLGVRVNFSARCVITPHPPEKEIDEISIPYVTFLELYKFHLIKIISTMRRTTISKALEIWSQAQSKFDAVVYHAMKEMIKRAPDGGMPILLNRNPTIAFGSILLMRITEVKRSLHDMTASLSNNVLKLLGADFDGDVLNIIVLLDKDFADAFRVFDPRLMMVSRDAPELNQGLAPDKDYALGISVLTEG